MALQQVVNLGEHGIEICVFDMAGTTVDEGGLVYKSLQEALLKVANLSISHTDLSPFHGADKREVLQHFISQHCINEGEASHQALVNSALQKFNEIIEEVYFAPTSSSCSSSSLINPMRGALELFDKLRSNGIGVFLETGYPFKIAEKLVKTLGFESHIDGFISASEVKKGRPFPYMIDELILRYLHSKSRDEEASAYSSSLSSSSSSSSPTRGTLLKICKVGDTARDMEEGVNSGATLIIGVLSGADDAETLWKAGATHVLPSIQNLSL